MGVGGLGCGGRGGEGGRCSGGGLGHSGSIWTVLGRSVYIATILNIFTQYRYVLRWSSGLAFAFSVASERAQKSLKRSVKKALRTRTIKTQS